MKKARFNGLFVSMRIISAKNENLSTSGLLTVPESGATMYENVTWKRYLAMCRVRFRKDSGNSMRQQEKKTEMRLQAVDIANDVAKKQGA